MRKRHFGRLLSSALSVALAFTSVIPSYAMEGVDADDLAQAQEDAEAEEEETEEPAEEPVEEVPEELAATPAEEEEEDVLVEEDEDDVLVKEAGDPYTVTFDYNLAGGETDKHEVTVTENADNDQTVSAPDPAPTKTGYSLSGWYLKTGESEYSSSAYDFDTAVTGDITLRAGWTANSYKVTLNKNCTADVTGLPTPVEDFVGITVTYDGTYSELPTLTRTGYDFDGWFDATSAGNEIETTATVAITDDTTFYAHWTAKEYTVTFTPGEGASVDPTSTTVTYDSTYGTLPTPVKEGFTFGGWYDSADTSYASEITAATKVTITAPQTLIAKWTETSTPAEKVVITVKKIVGDAAAVDFGTVEVDKDSAIKAALITAEKNKDGSNTFVDFFTDGDCAESHKLAEGTVATEATTIYAKFTEATTPAEEFEVTFWDGDTQLTKIATQKVESGKFATKPAKDPVKTGYDFKGWFTTDELTTAFDFEKTSITAATKIYAKFEAKTFKVTLNKNCTGDVTGLPTASNGFVGIEVTYGGQYTDLPKLTREGYDFLGWYTDPKKATYERRATDTVSITADATLYAHWDIKEIDLTFDWNDKPSDSTKTPVTVDYGTKALSVAPKATLTGYKFDGWYDSKDFENENTKKLEATTLAKEDTTYYAKWVANKYTVKFDANGGTSTTAMANQSREYGDGVKLTANSYTRDHYSFVNWNTKKDGSGVAIANEATDDLSETDGATVTLYAQWDGEDVTVTYEYDYEKNAEEVTEGPVTVNYGDAYPAPDTDKLAGNPGFYFDGWYDKTDADKKIIDITKDKVKGNIVLKAKWTAVTYKATFNSNNSKKKTKTITLDATKTDPIAFIDVFEEADAAGQTFEGWATADNDYDSLTHAELIAELKGTESATAKTVTGVVYAQWASTGKYNIELDPNLPTGALDSDLLTRVNTIESVNFAEPFFLTGEEFRLFGYTLTGWTYKNAKGKTVTVKPAAKLVSLTTSKDATVKVSAKWKKTTYTLKYNLNGGTATRGTKTTVKFGVNDTTRAGIPFLNYNESFNIDEASKWVVTKKGYAFAGWTGYAEGSAYYGKDHYWNISLFARWTPNKYTIKLDPETGKFADDDGTDVRTVTTTATFQDSYGLGDDSTSAYKTGYTFKYWKATGANGKVKTYARNAYVNVKDLSPDEANGTVYTLKAVYAPKTNKVYYDLDGGKINKNAPKSYVTDGTSNKAIPDPTKDGFTFAGWTVQDEFDDPVANVLGEDKKIKAGISGNLYFVANWTVNTYTIEFYSNDGQTPFTAVTMTDKKYADAIDFTDTAIAIEGTTGFEGSVKGFAKATGAKKAAYALNKTYSKLGAKTETGKTLKLYVVGQPQIHRISYELNGGTLKNALYEYKTPTANAGLKLKTTATKKGFTFKGFTCDDENSVATNANGYVTAIKKGATADLELVAVFDNEVSYSIVAMPNAGDVVDENGPVDAKKGVQFQVDGERLFPISNSIPVDDLVAYLGWNRPGYDFKGFSTTKNGKKLIDTLGGLSYNKKKVATVYAIWTPLTNYIDYNNNAEIYRSDVNPTACDRYENLNVIGVKPVADVMQKVGSKAITPKKLSAKGYTFKGWKVTDSSDPDKLKVVYADKAKKYVKSVAKNNASSYVELTPVFEENYYNLYVNPNGGTYKGSKKKQLVGKLYYSEEVPLIAIISKLAKSGYEVDGVSTTKNYKGYVSPFRTGLSAKNKGSVTVNALWYKTYVVKPTVSATISGTDMDIYFGYTSKADDEIYYEIQYSPSSSFTYNVQTITLEADAWESGENGALKPISRTVVEGKDYYLRARMFRKDSTGKYVSSAWSATARASRRGVATDAYTVKNVIDNKAVAAGTVNVPKDGSMKIKDVLDAAKKNEKEGYDFGGYFTDDKCTTALEADATTLEAKVVYVKFTKKAEVAKVTVTFNAGDGKFADNTSTKQVEFTVGGTYGTDLPTVETVPENKEFAGWFDAQTGGNKITSSTEVTATLTTIYAQYTDATATTVDVTFNAGDGKFADNSSTKVVQFTIGGTYGADLPTVETVPENKEFAGWFDAQTGGNKITSSTEVTGTLKTIYAQYTDAAPTTITINLDVTNGTGATVSAATVTAGENGKLSSLPELATQATDGSKFLGWFTTKSEGGEQVTTDTVLANGDTIYARFTAVSVITVGGTLTHNGTAFDTSALTATVKYADDSTADVTAKATFAITPENPSGTGNENVSVVATYCGNSSEGTEMTATYVDPSAP